MPEEATSGTTLRRRFDQLDEAIERWLQEQNFAA
jgi:hypothetical protein